MHILRLSISSYKYYVTYISSNQHYDTFTSQKLEIRKSVLLKTTSLTDAQRDLWKKVVIKEFMSSEEWRRDWQWRRQVIWIKPLRWRAPKVNHFFKQLDHEACKVKSRQSKQQTLPRAGYWKLLYTTQTS